MANGLNLITLAVWRERVVGREAAQAAVKRDGSAEKTELTCANPG